MSHFYRTTRESNEVARDAFEAAIAMDPSFALAHAGLSINYSTAVTLGFSATPQEDLEKGMTHAEQAVRLDDREAAAQTAFGRLAIITGRTDVAIPALEKAVSLNPNFPLAHYCLGFSHNWLGNAAGAVAPMDVALRLSPRDPIKWTFHMIKAFALGRLGESDAAIENGLEAVRNAPDQLWANLGLTYAYAVASRIEEATRALEGTLRVRPDLTETLLRRMMATFERHAFEEIVTALRAAGLPE